MGIAFMLKLAFHARTTELSTYYADYLPLSIFSTGSHPQRSQDLLVEDLMASNIPLQNTAPVSQQ